MSGRLRVGVLGLGVGERHLDAYLGDARCDVVAVCDLDRGRAEAVAGRCPGARPSVDALAVARDPAVDAVSIATYDDAHADLVVAALEAGKHVLVEKPLCRTRPELSRVAAAHRARPDAVLSSNLVLRAAPAFAWLVGERPLGALYAFDGDYLYGRLWKLTNGWRGDVEGYSVMLGGGVHMVDLMILAVGERPSAVTCAGSGLATRSTRFTGADMAAATFEFPSGAIGRVTANFACVHRHQHVVRAFGADGTLVSDDRGVRVSRARDPHPAEDAALSALPASKGALVGPFVDAALGTGPAAPGAAHEMAVVAACLAADEGMRNGSRVEVEYP